MIFADLVGGDSLFLDANPLVYHFSADLSKIASNDADFDRVPGITRYAPS